MDHRAVTPGEHQGVRSIRRPFAGTEWDFVLTIDGVMALEQLCGCGIAEIYTRLATMRWTAREVRETIRLGLIGAGHSDLEAKALVTRFLDACWIGGGTGLADHVDLASAIVGHVLTGLPPEALKKPEGETMPAAPATPPPSGAPPAPSA